MSQIGEWERKLDHRLKAALDRAARDPQGASRVVSVFVRFLGDVSQLQALGCGVRSVAGDIAIANVRLADVPDIACSPLISFIELSAPAHLDN